MRKERGSTALEVAVAAVLFSGLLVSLSGSLTGAMNFMSIQLEREKLSRKSLVAVDRITASLRGVMASAIIEPVEVPIAPDDPTLETGDGTYVATEWETGTVPEESTEVPTTNETVTDPVDPLLDLPDVFGALLTDGISEITFTRVIGVNDDGALQYGAPIKIFWRPAPREVMDGKDNNRNGLIDDGEVVLIDEAGYEAILATAVPNGGFRLWDRGDGSLTVSITFQTRVHEPRKLLARTVEVRLPLRQ